MLDSTQYSLSRMSWKTSLIPGQLAPELHFSDIFFFYCCHSEFRAQSSSHVHLGSICLFEDLWRLWMLCLHCKSWILLPTRGNMYSMLSYLVTQVSYGSLLPKQGRQDNKPPLLNCHQPSNDSFGRAKISSSDDNHQGPCYSGDFREYMDMQFGPLARPLGSILYPW